MHDERPTQPNTSGARAPWGGGVRPAQNLQPTTPATHGATHGDEQQWQSKMTEHKLLHFPTQRPNEHVILLLRRHWTVLAGDVLQLVVSLVLPPLVLTLIFLFTDFRLDPTTPLYATLVGALSLYYLFSFLAYFHDFVDYHLDIWVVTDQRIVSIEQEGLFNRIVSELNITRIQDVTSQLKGKVQTFLDYGSVHIQTAGEAQRFVFEQVSHPAEVAKVILQVHDRALRQEEVRRMREENHMRHQYDGSQQGLNDHMPSMGQPMGQQTAHTPYQYTTQPQQGPSPTTAPTQSAAPIQPAAPAGPQQREPMPYDPPGPPQEPQIRNLSPQQRRSQLHQSPAPMTGQEKQDNTFGPLDY